MKYALILIWLTWSGPNDGAMMGFVSYEHISFDFCEKAIQSSIQANKIPPKDLFVAACVNQEHVYGDERYNFIMEKKIKLL